MLSNIDNYSSINIIRFGEITMSTTKDLQLARFLKVILDIIFGALVIACLALLLWMALYPLIMSQTGILGTASIPVTIGVGEEAQFDVAFTGELKDDISAAFVTNAEGTLRLETRSTWLIVISSAAKLLVAIGLAYIFYLLRAVVQAIRNGEPFAAENGRRVRRLGYAVILIGFLEPAVEYAAATEILNRLPPTLPVLNAGPMFDAGFILTALFILLLAHIWSYGLELERDRALTI
jgi:hypothetical protein